MKLKYTVKVKSNHNPKISEKVIAEVEIDLGDKINREKFRTNATLQNKAQEYKKELLEKYFDVTVEEA